MRKEPLLPIGADVEGFSRIIVRSVGCAGLWLALLVLPVSGAVGPVLLRDRPAASPDLHVGVGGLTATYKHVSGPFEFGGGMIVWGLRAMGGKVADPKLGISGGAGVLHGNALRLHLNMGGLTLENSFRPDPRFGWRVGFGLGRYHLTSHVTKRTIHRGSFTYLEPMLTGMLPLNRHLALEFAAGYTFAGATGVKIEGFFLQSEFLVGRF